MTLDSISAAGSTKTERVTDESDSPVCGDQYRLFRVPPVCRRPRRAAKRTRRGGRPFRTDPYRGSRSWDVRYTVEPAPDVLATGNRSGTLNWQPASGRDLRLRLRLVIGATQPPGPLIAARVALQWPDGKHESLDIRVVVIPRAAVAAKGSKDFLVALTPVTRAASPGGSAKLRYTVVSNEETDERVRLRVEPGSGGGSSIRRFCSRNCRWKRGIRSKASSMSWFRRRHR